MGRLLNEVQELDTELIYAHDFEAARKECIQVVAMGIKLLAKFDERSTAGWHDGAGLVG